MCAGPSGRCSRLLLLPAHSRNLQGSQANNMDGGLATAKQGRWARGRKITRGDCHVWDIGRLTESGDRLEPHDEQKQAPAKHHVEQGHPASGTEPQMERPSHRAESKKGHFRHKTGHGLPRTATDVESLTVAFPSVRKHRVEYAFAAGGLGPGSAGVPCTTCVRRRHVDSEWPTAQPQVFRKSWKCLLRSSAKKRFASAQMI